MKWVMLVEPKDFSSDFDPCHGNSDLNHRRCGGDVRQWWIFKSLVLDLKSGKGDAGLVIKAGLGTSILETSNAGQKLGWKSDR
ncbi:hypothetical protein OROHE_012462 [Orobanche hederae]